ncbi:hypothetical protein V6672_04270 [Vibrio mimicus]|uniref:Uncharacterized protein n=1 Tax=Vibrio mimicus TaxID=674 RepID=A0A2J9VLP6_VIBMI|nr:hypothetical protein [Vibrio mimicus]PNM64708.1 hypothetical protein AL544_006035 [Vibrio mimicus]
MNQERSLNPSHGKVNDSLHLDAGINSLLNVIYHPSFYFLLANSQFNHPEDDELIISSIINLGLKCIISNR